MDLPILDDFTPLCGERFELAIEPGQTLSAQLIEAQALPQPSFNGRQPFSLVFAGPPDPILPQRIYQLAHARLPAVDVFLVPVAANGDRVHYQAVFS